MKPSSVASILRKIATKISRSASKEAVTRDLRRVAAMIGDQKKAEEVLYGHSYTGPLPDDERGSSIWWDAFDAANIVDWTPFTDYAAVEAALKEAAQSWPEPGNLTPVLLQSLKKNWEKYQTSYMPEHVEILKANGIIAE